ncbi:hypothetical protein [Propionispora vibrioides]|uniref:Uncharacterized protein n=1 Tax=Propionispora vibrioides TaxID=112903 RepID=A0A1H8T4C0_9FIRM|nr:hypothetical protein [Propionispora vibrioides]SEO85702.1 hypothetical protein SAMN04490178_10618 [Propionispora vibrioides]
MTLGRYFIVAAIIFFIGLTALYVGVNRPPFRQTPQQEHTGNHHGTAPTEKTTADETLCPAPILQPKEKS